MTRLRAGRRVGRTLYAQQGPEPSDTDPVVGLVDTAALAAEIVEAVNAARERTAPPPGTTVELKDPHNWFWGCDHQDCRVELAQGQWYGTATDGFATETAARAGLHEHLAEEHPTQTGGWADPDEELSPEQAADELSRQTWDGLHRGTIPSDHEESP